MPKKKKKYFRFKEKLIILSMILGLPFMIKQLKSFKRSSTLPLARKGMMLWRSRIILPSKVGYIVFFSIFSNTRTKRCAKLLAIL